MTNGARLEDAEVEEGKLSTGAKQPPCRPRMIGPQAGTRPATVRGLAQ